MLQEQLIKYALQSPDEESVGLICGDNFVPCKNIHGNKKHYFSIDPIDYIKATKIGKITAIFHSHVNDSPGFSVFDYQQSILNNLEYWLYDLKSKTFKILKPQIFTKYINQPFKEGISDCFSLIRDFYKNELNIEIPNWFCNRKKGFVKIQKNLLETQEYKELGKSIGFNLVLDNNLKNFDILIFKFYDRLHMAIFLENNCILHQIRVKRSCIEVYTDEYKNSLICVLRKGINE